MANSTAAARCAALIVLPVGQDDIARSSAVWERQYDPARSVREGNSVGDHSAEARARQMSPKSMWRVPPSRRFLDDP